MNDELKVRLINERSRRRRFSFMLSNFTLAAEVNPFLRPQSKNNHPKWGGDYAGAKEI